MQHVEPAFFGVVVARAADHRHHQQIARARRGDVGETRGFIAIAARFERVRLDQLARRAARDRLGPTPRTT
jgi:hypothetical protein